MIQERDRLKLIELAREREQAQMKVRNMDKIIRKVLLTAQKNGASLAELGKAIGVSRQRVHQILNKA